MLTENSVFEYSPWPSAGPGAGTTVVQQTDLASALSELTDLELLLRLLFVSKGFLVQCPIVSGFLYLIPHC